MRSDHGVQENPEAIIEVRRILLEHLGTGPARAAVPLEARRPAEAGPVQLQGPSTVR